MINLTNLIALFRHHRKMATQPCSPTCFCHRVEEIIKEETEPKPKPKVIELATRRTQEMRKYNDSLKCDEKNCKPDDYANSVEKEKPAETVKPRLPVHVLDALVENAKKHDEQPNSDNNIVAHNNVIPLFSELTTKLDG